MRFRGQIAEQIDEVAGFRERLPGGVSQSPEAAKAAAPTQQRQELRRDNLGSCEVFISLLPTSKQVLQALRAQRGQRLRP